MARPVAIATPSRPSHSPANAMPIHMAVVSACHGDTMASAGAKKNPMPTYQAEPARSDFITHLSHRGIFWSLSACWRDFIVASSDRTGRCRTPSTFPPAGKRSNYLPGSGSLHPNGPEWTDDS
jgi:hypothetical protein